MTSHVSVLFSDYNEIWGSLSEMYWAQQTSVLITRHPLSSVEEIVSLFCPQCLARYSEEEATASLGRCPLCKECSTCFSTLTTDASFCGMCLAQSPQEQSNIHSTVSQQQELLFKALLNNLKSLSAGSDQKVPDTRKREQGVWQMEELRKKLETTVNADSSGQQTTLLIAKNAVDKVEVAVALANADGSSVLVATQQGVRLRSKRALRSKQDSRTGRMNILVQPKTLPLEGDSSLKLQKGKWWVKDSSAIHELPFVAVVALPNKAVLVQQSEPCFIELCITNPKMTEVRVSFFSDRLNEGFEPYLRLDRLGATETVQAANRLRASTRLLSDSQHVGPTGETASQQLDLLIGGFEDELLKDMDEETTSAAGTRKEAPPVSGPVDADASEGREATTAVSWTHRIVHNKAFVRIPVDMPAHVPSLHTELHLFCQVDLGSGAAIDLPFKVLFTMVS